LAILLAFGREGRNNQLGNATDTVVLGSENQNMFAATHVKTLSALLESIETGLDQKPGTRWFRGCSDFNHALLPSLMRHPDVSSGVASAAAMEERLTAKFRQTSPPFLGAPPDSKFDWMFLQQHYGVPTRLLDWTENPFIALYFALSDRAQNGPPCIWVLDPLEWTRQALNNPTISRIPEPQDSAARNFLDNLNDPVVPPHYPIALYSNHTNARIVAQRGTFTMFGVGTLPMERLPYARQCLQCFVIDEAVRAPLLGKLNAIGYTHSVVYPDLSGLGREIKTLFGF
jgi:hypothetical protein